jgi:hypothetical protein
MAESQLAQTEENTINDSENKSEIPLVPRTVLGIQNTISKAVNSIHDFYQKGKDTLRFEEPGPAPRENLIKTVTHSVGDAADGFLLNPVRRAYENIEAPAATARAALQDNNTTHRPPA